MTRWFVAMRPFASITNPDARVVGVQRATTLSCHCGRSERGVGLQRRCGGRRRRRDGLDLRVVGCQLEDRVAAGDDVHHLRPLVGLAVERDRPVRFHRVVPWAQPHVGGAIQRRDDPPGRRARRVVADEQRMARHRRRLPLGVDQDNLYMKDAERLAGGRLRDVEKQRREDQRAEHHGHRLPMTCAC